MTQDIQRRDQWATLRATTMARIGLGRTGTALKTADMLRFELDCARARDAVMAPMNVERLQIELAPWPSLVVHSSAPDRVSYLRDPDLGRRLDTANPLTLPHSAPDLVIVIGDGLSSRAAQNHAPAIVREICARLTDMIIAPIVIVEQARVAIADQIGGLLGAKASAILIGERPGLSSFDSMGIYLTYGPGVGRSDADKNCISNIHGAGLSYMAAAEKFTWLLRESVRVGFSGVGLKDEGSLKPLSSKISGPFLDRKTPDALAE